MKVPHTWMQFRQGRVATHTHPVSRYFRSVWRNLVVVVEKMILTFWLLDFIEATADCVWSDEQRVRWCSWFLSGPAKAKWHHTLNSSKKTWNSIMEIYKEQYGVHLDPRAA